MVIMRLVFIVMFVAVYQKMNDEQLQYIVNEDRSYEINVVDIESKAYRYLDYHNQKELRKWEYLNKIPRGIFGR